MHEWVGGTTMFGMWIWWLGAVAVIAAIGFGVAKTAGQKNKATGASADEMLNRRYANGEIEQQDYEARLQALRK